MLISLRIGISAEQSKTGILPYFRKNFLVA